MSFAWNEFYSYSPLNMHNTFKMVSNDENLRKWFKLELKLNAYSRLTILQKKIFTIIILIYPLFKIN